MYSISDDDGCSGEMKQGWGMDSVRWGNQGRLHGDDDI